MTSPGSPEGEGGFLEVSWLVRPGSPSHADIQRWQGPSAAERTGLFQKNSGGGGMRWGAGLSSFLVFFCSLEMDCFLHPGCLTAPAHLACTFGTCLETLIFLFFYFFLRDGPIFAFFCCCCSKTYCDAWVALTIQFSEQSSLSWIILHLCKGMATGAFCDSGTWLVGQNPSSHSSLTCVSKSCRDLPTRDIVVKWTLGLDKKSCNGRWDVPLGGIPHIVSEITTAWTIAKRSWQVLMLHTGRWAVRRVKAPLDDEHLGCLEVWGLCCDGNGLVNAYSWSGGKTWEQFRRWLKPKGSLTFVLVDWIESQRSVHYLSSHSSFPKMKMLYYVFVLFVFF